MNKIKKILVANRGEIAVRIIRSAKEMGIETVAICSEVDKNGFHIRFADACFELKSAGKPSYLDIDQMIEIAVAANADSIHPGYGFLSENAEFAAKVEQSGLIFIGPSHESIKLMGDKVVAKELAQKAGVPVIPGFLIENPNDHSHIAGLAEAIGYPVLIKARAGGGGKGMRLVHAAASLMEDIQRARSEAEDAFGDGSVFIEKFIENPRHIEVQVLADQHGNSVHLFERECSIQRRHQKVIEEAPSVAVRPDLRHRMGACAMKLVNACGYENAGTIEFILDKNEKFYFLEMNTRLQVEHPVTELITGLDLVKEQIKIARGERMALQQEDVTMTGHAIELRVYAEDPANGFLPDIGKLDRYRIPGGPGVRVDGGYEEGMEIPIDYDPLIAKLLAHGKDRNEAIARMKRAIEEFQIIGVKNTLLFGSKVMEDRDFCSGNFDTNFVANKSAQFGIGEVDRDEILVAAMLGASVFSADSSVSFKNVSDGHGKWRERLK
jgi:acetyl-CoA carboxylase biotin carboxylase subunit